MGAQYYLQDPITISYRPRVVCHEVYTGLGGTIGFAAGPKCRDGLQNSQNTYYWPGDSFYVLGSGHYAPGQSYRTQGGGWETQAGADANQAVMARRDVVPISSSTNGAGWEHQMMVRGNHRYLLNTFAAGREIRQCIREYVDAAVDAEGFDQRVCINATWTRSFVKDTGGIAVVMDGDSPGTQRGIITSVTPDYFLGSDRMRLPRMCYLHRPEVELERAEASTKVHTEASLGYKPFVENAGLGFGDPVGGFEAHLDNWTLTYNDTLTPAPANERHIMANVSTAYALQEIMGSHVYAGFGGSMGSISRYFPIHITPDAENAVMTLDVAEGSVWNMIQEASRHGNYEAFFTAQSEFFFFPGYSSPTGTIPMGNRWPQALCGKNFVGTFSVNPGPPGWWRRVNRVGVRATGLGMAGGEMTNLQWWAHMPTAGLWPPGQGPGAGGKEIYFENYQGANVVWMAHSEFNRQSQLATITIDRIPWVCWAIDSYKRPVTVYVQDAMGAFDYSVGYCFSVENVQITYQNPDGFGGVIPLATVTLREVISS